MNNLKSNLKDLLVKHRLSALDLAQKTGIGQPVISRLLSGTTRNPQISSLLPIAKFFRLPVEDLIRVYNAKNTVKKFRKNRHHDEYTKIPLLSESQIIRILLENIPFQLKGTPTFILNRKVNNNVYAFNINDYCSNPVFPNNTIAVVASDLSPNHKDFVLVHNREQIYFRRYLFINNKTFLEIPTYDNPDLKLLLPDEHIIGTILRFQIHCRIH
jgi:transcriptional regulator with XRE-family HTH domain